MKGDEWPEKEGFDLQLYIVCIKLSTLDAHQLFTGGVTVSFNDTQFLFSLLCRGMAVQNRNISLLICFAA